MSEIVLSTAETEQLAHLVEPGGTDSALPLAASAPQARFQGPLGQRLLSADLLGADELDAALTKQAESGKRLGEVLLELGLVNEDDLVPYVEAQLGVPAVRLREGLLDPAAVHRLPRRCAEQLNVLVLFCVRGTITLAMDDPFDLAKIDQVERLTGSSVRPVFAFAQSIARMIRRGYEEDFQVDAVTADMDDASIEVRNETPDVDVSSVHDLVEGSPVINLVNYLVLQAVRKGASDIHIEPGRKSAAVRYRIDGQLVEVLRPRRDIYPAIVSRIKVMGKLDIAEHHLPQDGRCQVVADGKEVDLRISTMPTVLGEKVVLRVLDKQRLTFDLNRLGMPAPVLEIVRNLLRRPHGLLLVTGPTGSGKTTTLYSALELIKSASRNIVTVEDPVEYQIEQVNQVQVDDVRSVNFTEALRSILRQDPDVIMVGEIRDAETAKVAVQAALTGHLVLSTLHTNDSAGAVIRLMDMGVENYKLAAALIGVVAQRLVRTICPNCRSTHYPPAEYLAALGFQGDVRRSFSRGEGCRECFDSGFSGRTGVYEVMPFDADLRRLVAHEAGLEAMRGWLTRHGYQTLLSGALQVAEADQTSLEEVARVALFD